MLINNIVRHWQEVRERQSQVISMRAVAPNDAQDSAIGTVPRISGLAKFAISAAGVNLAYNSFPHQLVARRFFHHADKLVANSPLEARIAARNFEIGIADAGKVDAHK